MTKHNVLLSFRVVDLSAGVLVSSCTMKTDSPESGDMVGSGTDGLMTGYTWDHPKIPLTKPWVGPNTELAGISPSGKGSLRVIPKSSGNTQKARFLGGAPALISPANLRHPRGRIGGAPY